MSIYTSESANILERSAIWPPGGPPWPPRRPHSTDRTKTMVSSVEQPSTVSLEAAQVSIVGTVTEVSVSNVEVTVTASNGPEPVTTVLTTETIVRTSNELDYYSATSRRM